MDQSYNNSVKYHGFVTVKVLKGDKTIKTIKTHNAGTTLLFKLISSMLCGNNESVNMPRYFDFGIHTQEEYSSGSFKSNLANRISLSPKVIKDFTLTVSDSYETKLFRGTYGASFTALIPALQVIAEQTIDTLRLYSSSYGGDETLLAEVKLDNSSDPLTVSYTEGYNYMIEWVMTFENSLTGA